MNVRLGEEGQSKGTARTSWGGVPRLSAPADFNIGNVDPLYGHLSTPDVT